MDEKTPFPPLTKDELRALDEKTKGDVDMRRLLWEVRRLRALVYLTDQMVDARFHGRDRRAMEIASHLRVILADEPVVREYATGFPWWRRR